MDKKVSVYVLVPQKCKKINFLVPETMTIDVMRLLILKLLSKSGYDDFVQESSVFISCCDGSLVQGDDRLCDAGISDGYEFVLWG